MQVFCMPFRHWVQHSVSSLVVFLLIYTSMWTKFQPAGKLRNYISALVIVYFRIGDLNPMVDWFLDGIYYLSVAEQV